MYQQPHHREFLASFGEMIVKWNHAESHLYGMLSMIAGGGVAISIVTIHMTSVNACDALRTMAQEGDDPALAAHIAHYVGFFERVREYRNYYVHGIKHLTNDETIPTYARAETLSAKGRYTAHVLKISAEDLRVAGGYCDSLLAYGSRITGYMVFKKMTFPALQAFQELPEKPDLPPKLDKPKLLILASKDGGPGRPG